MTNHAQEIRTALEQWEAKLAELERQAQDLDAELGAADAPAAARPIGLRRLEVGLHIAQVENRLRTAAVVLTEADDLAERRRWAA